MMAYDTAGETPMSERINMALAHAAADTPIVDGNACKRFVLGGRAVFTLQGQSTRYTFKVARKEPTAGSRYVDPVYFVSLLTGPDNTADYTYVGIVDVRTGQIRLTAKSTYKTDSIPVRAFGWAMAHIWAGRALPSPAAFYHVGRCARCGRALTVPESILSGFGPECLAKLEGM